MRSGIKTQTSPPRASVLQYPSSSLAPGQGSTETTTTLAELRRRRRKGTTDSARHNEGDGGPWATTTETWQWLRWSDGEDGGAVPKMAKHDSESEFII